LRPFKTGLRLFFGILFSFQEIAEADFDSHYFHKFYYSVRSIPNLLILDFIPTIDPRRLSLSLWKT
jgi:hypothetical protein